MNIHIDKCTTPGAWYESRVGQILLVEWLEMNRHPSQGIPEDVYWCREGGRFNALNYVRVSDATPVEDIATELKRKLTAASIALEYAFITSTVPVETAPAGPELSLTSLEEARRQLERFGPPVVGIVCRPDHARHVQQLSNAHAHPLFGSVPVYEKTDQAEPIRTFYSNAELGRYLKS